MTDRTHPLPADERVERLVHLARQAPAEHLTPREWAGLHRLERTLLEGTHRRRTPVWVRWIALASILGAIVAGLSLRLRERALTFEVMNATVSDGGYILARGLDASVRFSDRSELGADPGTRLRVSRLEAHGARVMLEGGLLHVRIRPEPRATWTLDAGPYIVHVTGTEFDLAWRVDEQTLDLRLVKGSVTVDGPLANGGLKMVAGEHLVANAADGSLSIVNGLDPEARATGRAPTSSASTRFSPMATGSASAADEGPLIPQARTHPLTPRADAPAAGAVAGAHAGEQDWAARVARGDFASVIEDAEHRGLERSLAKGSPVDLAALADAARYARRPDLARRALTTARVRFPTAVQARDAAFFLGGLTEAQQDAPAAVGWYDVYLSESPEGAYASQALGRKMVLLEKTQRPDGAMRAANEYLRRFGEGPYAPAARRLLEAR